MGGPVVGLGITAVCFWGLICAAMSTIDSYVMTASQSLFIDVVARPGNRTAPEKLVAELSAHAKKRLPAHAVPASLQLVEQLPRNLLGKVLRRKLAAQAGTEQRL